MFIYLIGNYGLISSCYLEIEEVEERCLSPSGHLTETRAGQIIKEMSTEKGHYATERWWIVYGAL